MPERHRKAVVADGRKLDWDVATVEALARLALDARRLGCSLRIEGCSDELVELIAFLGLDEVLVSPSRNISRAASLAQPNRNISRATSSAAFPADEPAETSPTSTDDGFPP